MRHKYNNETISNVVENMGYKLIHYKDEKNLIRLFIEDNVGFKYSVYLSNLIRGKFPRRFNKYNFYVLDNIRLWLKINNKSFKLIGNIYINEKENLQWQCLNPECGEVFNARWDNIYQNRNCPYCSGKQVGLSNCLATKRPDLVDEWHKTLNDGLTSYDVTWCSGKYIWWKCKECGHDWVATVASRTSVKSGCPECNKSKGEKAISKYLNFRNFDYIPQKEFNGLLGLGNGFLSYDFYLRKYNLLIEFQGEQHEHYCKGFHKDENTFIGQVEHDRRKKEYALTNNIKLLEIWYWDFDNIEEILQREISLEEVVSIA